MDYLYLFSLFVRLLLLFFNSVSSSGEIRSAKLKRTNGYHFKSENVLQEVEVRNSMTCVSYCDYVTDCVAVAWNENTHVCQLSSLHMTHDRHFLEGFTPSGDWIIAVKIRHQIFHRAGPGRYSLNFPAATAECADNGFVIADPKDLIEAKDAGYDVCICGWLSDGTNVVILQHYYAPCWHTFSDGYELCYKTLADVYCKFAN